MFLSLRNPAKPESSRQNDYKTIGRMILDRMITKLFCRRIILPFEDFALGARVELVTDYCVELLRNFPGVKRTSHERQ